MTLLLQANNISLRFGQKVILTDVELSVHRGEIVTLIGPNGAGKSTIVRIVLGLLKPDTGKVTLAPHIKIGYMPQRLHVEPYLPLSVKRFLKLTKDSYSNKENFYSILKQVGVSHLLSQALQELSGGELQRVLLARALLRSPDLLVLDEPVQGVDITGQEELYNLIVQIRDELNCGILMVSHDLHLVMAGTDSVICLNKHVCCSGLPEDVTKHPEFVSLFGTLTPKGIAIYQHRHNHRHD